MLTEQQPGELIFAYHASDGHVSPCRVSEGMNCKAQEHGPENFITSWELLAISFEDLSAFSTFRLTIRGIVRCQSACGTYFWDNALCVMCCAVQWCLTWSALLKMPASKALNHVIIGNIQMIPFVLGYVIKATCGDSESPASR